MILKLSGTTTFCAIVLCAVNGIQTILSILYLMHTIPSTLFLIHAIWSTLFYAYYHVDTIFDAYYTVKTTNSISDKEESYHRGFYRYINLEQFCRLIAVKGSPFNFYINISQYLIPVHRIFTIIP